MEEQTTLLVDDPEISDIIKAQFDVLKDPSTWDYVLYLETTKSGQLVNQLIPGTGEKILNFKINLLSASLGKNAILLEMPEDDALAMAEIIHHVSLRQTLHTMTLAGPEKNNEIALAIFGLNPLFQKDAPIPLLSKLHDGTLFIRNVEYSSLDTQNALAHFLKHGFFSYFKSDHKIISNIVLFSFTTKDLLSFVHEGTFSKDLYNVLHRTTLALPPLHNFSEC